MAVWRNGSASDYESGGCSFEYYLGHFFISSSPGERQTAPFAHGFQPVPDPTESKV